MVYDKGAGEVEAKIVPATALTGGGSIAENIVVPVNEYEEADVDFWATATDLTGNPSKKSNIVNKTIDRLPPGAPQ